MNLDETCSKMLEPKRAISDFDITSDSMDTPTINDLLNSTVATVKYWIIISLFGFFRGSIERC
jgi:hypothetical protein